MSRKRKMNHKNRRAIREGTGGTFNLTFYGDCEGPWVVVDERDGSSIIRCRGCGGWFAWDDEHLHRDEEFSCDICGLKRAL